MNKRMLNRRYRVLVCNGEEFVGQLESGSYLDESQKLDFELIPGTLSEVACLSRHNLMADCCYAIGVESGLQARSALSTAPGNPNSLNLAAQTEK